MENVMYAILLLIAMSAQDQGKEIEIWSFHASWCPPCQRMNRETWTNKDLRKLLKEKSIKHVIIDTDTQKVLARAWNVSAIPVTIICRKTRKNSSVEIKRYLGFVGPKILIKDLNSLKPAKQKLNYTMI
jgi:thiol-disulfide isomerase/thioredoxin